MSRCTTPKKKKKKLRQKPRPAYLGKEHRGKELEVTDLDMRNPSIGQAEVFEVYQRFLLVLSK